MSKRHSFRRKAKKRQKENTKKKERTKERERNCTITPQTAPVS